MSNFLFDQDQIDSAALFHLANRRKYKETILNQEWLNKQPKDLLVKLVMALTTQLDAATTATIKASEIADSSTAYPWPNPGEKEKLQEVIVPASKAEQLQAADKHWVMELAPKKHSFQNLRITILDDFVIGRGSSLSDVDLNLSAFDAAFFGVSGLHAEIRVAKDGLYLNDLHSSNGTYCQWDRVEPGSPQKIHAGDDIAFGKLTFRIKSIKQID